MDEKIIEEVENEIKEELEKQNIKPDMFGYINVFENRKKEILKEKYGVEFKTTQEKHTSYCID